MLKTLVRTSSVVVGDVFAQNTTQMDLIDDEHFVQTFSADGAHPALGEGIGVRGAQGGVNDFDVFRLKKSCQRMA